jgi:hypothetical protein
MSDTRNTSTFSVCEKKKKKKKETIIVSLIKQTFDNGLIFAKDHLVI